MFWFMLFCCFVVLEAETVVETTTQPQITSSTIVTTQETHEQSTPISTETTKSSIRVIEGLKSVAHGVRSGKIMIIGNNVFQIPNFHFDGRAPTAFFIVGTGNEISPDNSTSIHLEGSTAPLPGYNGESVKLTLPDGLTVDKIDWLAVWCFKFHQNLGYVFLHKQLSPYPPQTYNLQNIVTSGPVILINKRTLYIPNFRYDGTHKNVYFWAGNGTEPSSTGTIIPNENGSLESLHSYQGQNLNINLPDGITTDNIDYFGVWSTDEGMSLGYVPIKGIEGVPEASPRMTSFATSLRLPKCCSIDSILTSDGCKERLNPPPFRPDFKVYEHNETHFSNESLDKSTIEFIPYTFTPVCRVKYPLDEETEEFAILLNSSLLVKGAALSGIRSTDEFCLENVEFDNETFMKIIVCYPERKIQQALFVTYVAFTIISTFCLAITFFVYFFWLNVSDVHRKCFTAYAFTMTITFLSLTIVQTAKIENSGCKVIGFFFQIFMMASFTLLGILCVDIFIIIKYLDEKKWLQMRQRVYVGVAIGIPLLFLIISLSRNLTPDVPNSFFKYVSDQCHFEAENQRTIIFYVPICLSMVVGTVFLILTKLKMVQNDRDKENDYFWLDNSRPYKFMWRKFFIVFATSLLWVIDTVIHMYAANSNMLIAIDILQASQGILVLLLFVVNKETRAEIIKRIKDERKRRKGKCNTEFELNCTTEPMLS